MRGSLLQLAEAVKAAAKSTRVKREVVELTDAAADRIKQLLGSRHKVGTACMRVLEEALMCGARTAELP